MDWPQNALILFAGAVLLIASPAWSQLERASSETRAACQQYMKTPLPADATQIAKPSKWPACNSYLSYYGIGTSIDYGAARKCAWQERLSYSEDISPDISNVFGGSALLSVLYANGDGVTKNIPLAIRFACEQGWAPAEYDGRIDHLKALENDPAPKNKFSFCDDVTSGFMAGFCASLESDLQEQKMKSNQKRLTQTWTVEQKAAFALLTKARDLYAAKHGYGETDHSGTAHAAFEIEAEDEVKNKFQQELSVFEKGQLPQGTSDDAQKADAELNRVYRTAMENAGGHKSDIGAVQPTDIRDAERAWIRYRDAWIAFAKLRYPTASTDVWMEFFTKERICALDDEHAGCKP